MVVKNLNPKLALAKKIKKVKPAASAAPKRTIEKSAKRVLKPSKKLKSVKKEESEDDEISDEEINDVEPEETDQIDQIDDVEQGDDDDQQGEAQQDAGEDFFIEEGQTAENGAEDMGQPHDDDETGLSIERQRGDPSETYLFDDLPINERTRSAIEQSGFKKMTEIQCKSIPVFLSGKDILGAAKTGSGKTLAFLVPAIDILSQARFKPHNGTGVLVLAPTRELALQIYGVAKNLMATQSQTFGIVMGGTSRIQEESKLAKGCNLLIATPGRLIDHLTNTSSFVFKHLRCLIIDEADRMLDIGFEEELRQIIHILPKDRQTIFFSATQTQKVSDMARLCFHKKKPVYIGVDDNRDVATVDTLEQGYVVCPEQRRFLLLFTFLKKNFGKKIIIFMSSCDSVKFHSDLLNYIDMPVLELYGNQKQQKRTATFFEFINAKSGILISTDVAARGLDIPAVDWIVQYDPPDDPKEYIHRVGRTARNGSSGRALMFLLPSETGFLAYLKSFKVPLNEYVFPQNKIVDIQAHLENLIDKNYFLHTGARNAFRAYLLSYAAHSLKEVYDVNKVDIIGLAKSFCFENPPKVNLQFLADRSQKQDKGMGSLQDKNPNAAKHKKTNSRGGKRMKNKQK